VNHPGHLGRLVDVLLAQSTMAAPVLPDQNRDFHTLEPQFTAMDIRGYGESDQGRLSFVPQAVSLWPPELTGPKLAAFSWIDQGMNSLH
jgi:hypothetical protein